MSRQYLKIREKVVQAFTSRGAVQDEEHCYSEARRSGGTPPVVMELLGRGGVLHHATIRGGSPAGSASGLVERGDRYAAVYLQSQQYMPSE